MYVKNHVININSRVDSFRLYVLGDLHIGNIGCSEDKLKKLVNIIKEDNNAYWIGGGDTIDCINIKDKRFHPNIFPDWLLIGDPNEIRENIGNYIACQISHAIEILSPIQSKCIGMIYGNHEETIEKHSSINVQKALCDAFNTIDLTDCAFIRLNCIRHGSTRNIDVFIAHGTGGGITYGSETNRLSRLISDKKCDILFVGHTHSPCILPPLRELGIHYKQSKDKLYIKDKYRYATNWGSFLDSYKEGPANYASRKLYPPRTITTVKTEIIPFSPYQDRDIVSITQNFENL